MINLIPYDNFLSEAVMSSVTKFLKAQYNNIFKDANQPLNNLFVDFTKKIDVDKNVSNLFERFIRTNQTTVQNEINKAESIDAINKIVIDEIKFFYFSLKSVANKLQNDDFTMEKIFAESGDRNLRTLMNYPEDQFANAVNQYAMQEKPVPGAIPQIKTNAGLDKQQPQQNQQQPATESMMYHIYRILEADQPAVATDEDLTKYKQSAINWTNQLFDLLKPKIQLLRQMGQPVTANSIDQVSRMMKGTTNDNAKKMILNNVVNMDKEQLAKLAEYMGINKEELGQL